MSQLKIKDGNSWINIPAGGIGVPSGGTAGQVLTKSSATDYATEWALPLSMKLLWTNPSPDASFAAQTVSLDLSEYDIVAIEQRLSTASAYYSFTLGRKGTTMVTCTKYEASGSVGGRTAQIAENGIVFGQGYAANTGSSSNAIPTRIYGIKGIT